MRVLARILFPVRRLIWNLPRESRQARYLIDEELWKAREPKLLRKGPR